LSVRPLVVLAVIVCWLGITRAGLSQSTQGVIVSEGSLDVGGAVLQQPGLTATNVMTAGGQFRLATPVSALFANGVGARTSDNGFTGQGVMTGSLFAQPAQRFRWELTATGSAFGLSNAAPAFAWQGLLREHVSGSLGGAFIGVGGGQLSRSSVRSAIGTAQTGAYLQLDNLGRDQLSAAIAYTSATASSDVVDGVHYSDIIGYWTHRTHALELDAGGGVRVFAWERAAGQPWASANGTLWMSDRTAIVVSAGRALADVTRGIPSVRYLSLSFRVGTRPGTSGTALHVRRSQVEDDGGRLDLRQEGQADDAQRVITIHLPLAAGVELMADFTEWEPVAMTRLSNGDWRLERAIAPGTHRLAIRVDGGPWTVPPNLPRVQDDFGGEVGILIVP
jgi:hypothetical protein